MRTDPKENTSVNSPSETEGAGTGAGPSVDVAEDAQLRDRKRLGKAARKRRRSRQHGESASSADPTSPPQPAQGAITEGLDESLGLGDGDMTSALFFSSAPPPPPESSLVIEDWGIDGAELSKRQIERKGRLKRIAVAVIAFCAVCAVVAIGVEVARNSSAPTPLPTMGDTAAP